jgi:hypothetical protein
MPGTLVITTLSDGTNSTSSTNCIQGSAKAWVSFNGSSASIYAAYNVSSITRTGTGQYTVNYTNALPDANYAPTATAAGGFVGCMAGDPPTTTNCKFISFYVGAYYDSTYFTVAVFR